VVKLSSTRQSDIPEGTKPSAALPTTRFAVRPCPSSLARTERRSWSSAGATVAYRTART
jgi:hypothetical protein